MSAILGWGLRYLFTTISDHSSGSRHQKVKLGIDSHLQPYAKERDIRCTQEIKGISQRYCNISLYLGSKRQTRCTSSSQLILQRSSSTALILNCLKPPAYSSAWITPSKATIFAMQSRERCYHRRIPAVASRCTRSALNSLVSHTGLTLIIHFVWLAHVTSQYAAAKRWAQQVRLGRQPTYEHLQSIRKMLTTGAQSRSLWIWAPLSASTVAKRQVSSRSTGRMSTRCLCLAFRTAIRTRTMHDTCGRNMPPWLQSPTRSESHLSWTTIMASRSWITRTAEYSCNRTKPKSFAWTWLLSFFFLSNSSHSHGTLAFLFLSLSYRQDNTQLMAFHQQPWSSLKAMSFPSCAPLVTLAYCARSWLCFCCFYFHSRLSRPVVRNFSASNPRLFDFNDAQQQQCPYIKNAR